MTTLEWRLGGWRDAAEARDLLGSGVRLLARNAGPEFSFAAADLSTSEITVRRSAVILRAGDEAAAFLFDVASAPFSRVFGGATVHEIRRPRPGVDSVSALACTEHAMRIEGVDLVGGVWRDWVVLFHTGLNAAQSSLSFDCNSGSRFLITGLGPGHWDIWRDGWLEDMALRFVRLPLHFDSTAVPAASSSASSADQL